MERERAAAEVLVRVVSSACMCVGFERGLVDRIRRPRRECGARRARWVKDDGRPLVVWCGAVGNWLAVFDMSTGVGALLDYLERPAWWLRVEQEELLNDWYPGVAIYGWIVNLRSHSQI